MFDQFVPHQFPAYNAAQRQLIQNPAILIGLEKYLIDFLFSVLSANLAEIKADYNEASYLYPFWKNYPPDDRGRAPIKDQYPWIEVGEHSIGCKLPRLLTGHFKVRDIGLPTGADQRFLLTHSDIGKITQGLTDSAWLFIDIKSVGPRDDADHTVMSHNQVSGDGIWGVADAGVKNTILKAKGSVTSHDFHCSMPPLVVLSDKKVAPVIIVALKPVYHMVPAKKQGNRNEGQPLIRIDLASIPNGLLLMHQPAYLQQYPGLLFPGKDDKTKNPLKLRARISFEKLRAIDAWRYQTIPVPYP